MQLGAYEVSGIYEADAKIALESLPAESVDLFVDDPPYGIGYKGGRTYANSIETGMQLPRITKNKSFGVDIFDPSYLLPAYRALIDGGAMYLFTRWDVIQQWAFAATQAGFKVAQRLVWVKKHWGMGNCAYHGNMTEDILFLVKGKHRLRWDKRRGNVLTGHTHGMYLRSTDGWYDHPTQKPESLIAELVKLSSDEGQVVCDPHLGSGTTAAVCAKLGRRYLGFEINPEFVAMAQQRVGAINAVSME